MCQKEADNYLKRLKVCITSRGVHLNDFLFEKRISGKKIFEIQLIDGYFRNRNIGNFVFWIVFLYVFIKKFFFGIQKKEPKLISTPNISCYLGVIAARRVRDACRRANIIRKIIFSYFECQSVQDRFRLCLSYKIKRTLFLKASWWNAWNFRFSW